VFSGVVLTFVAIHFIWSSDLVTVLVVNRTQAPLVLQVDEVSYRVAPGARPVVSSHGQLRYVGQVLSEACEPLATFGASAGDSIAVTVQADGSVTVETGVAIEAAQIAVALPDDPCPTPGVSIEILLRNVLLVGAALSGVLGLGLLLRRRTAG